METRASFEKQSKSLGEDAGAFRVLCRSLGGDDASSCVCRTGAATRERGSRQIASQPKETKNNAAKTENIARPSGCVVRTFYV